MMQVMKHEELSTSSSNYYMKNGIPEVYPNSAKDMSDVVLVLLTVVV